MHTYVIGDVHGMLNKLEELLDKIPFNADRDELAFLGDYIDRGPHSRGVIDRILQLRQECRVMCLRGNHEVMFKDYLGEHDPALFLINGGKETLKSYPNGGKEGSVAIPDPHISFLDDLLPYFETEEFILVHAGLRPGVPLPDQSEEDMCWIRRDFICSCHDFGKRVIFGHTSFKTPYMDDYKIGIDTGAVYGNLLTCVRLPDIEFYSV